MLVSGGMRTVQLIGTPEPGDGVDADAIVVALKTRSIESAAAVAKSLEALDYLETLGVRQVMFKYCSTFDSTDRGNIGPVADALAERLGQSPTVFCPAYPANGRSVYRGYLFVGDVPLSESGMRDHPLTPMGDANLLRVLARQSRRPVRSVGLHDVRRGAPAIREALERLAGGEPAHAIVDATEDDDLTALAEAVAGARLVTGGAGIALGLPRNFRLAGLLGAGSAVADVVRGGRAAVICGSASVTSRTQLAEFRRRHPVFDLTAEDVAEPDRAVARALAWANSRRDDAAIAVSGTAEPEAIRRNQVQFGIEEAGQRVESILSSVAAGLVGGGVRRIIVAGGETSGAVVRGLAVRRLRIGPRIDIGVPWTVADGSIPLGLALKSGNFGAADFFERAIAMTA